MQVLRPRAWARLEFDAGGSNSEFEPAPPRVALISQQSRGRQRCDWHHRDTLGWERRRTRCRAGGGAWCMLCGRAREQGSNSTPEARIPNSSPPPVTLTSRTNHEAADAALGTKGTRLALKEKAHSL